MTARGERLGVGAVTRIVGGLAAAGLALGHLDDAAGVLEQLDGGETDGRTEEVDEAGDEQRHPQSGRGRGRDYWTRDFGSLAAGALVSRSASNRADGSRRGLRVNSHASSKDSAPGGAVAHFLAPVSSN